MRKKIQKTKGDRVFEIATFIVVTIMGLICLYPVVYTFSASISDPLAVVSGKVYFWPVGFSTMAYEIVLGTPNIWRYYYNTCWYTVVGTLFNVIFTVMLAYPLSKPSFVLRRAINFMIVVTMFFSGGLIPTFILVNSLGLYGTRMAMVFIGMINAFNVILARTFFKSLPPELFENAMLEGASEFRVLRSIVVPLSKPIIAVLVLYYGVYHWNAFFTALVYLPKSDMQPIQVVLRRVVLQGSREFTENASSMDNVDLVSNQVKYAAIFFTMVPIMCLYPLLQKYFVKGVMIGALKG